MNFSRNLYRPPIIETSTGLITNLAVDVLINPANGCLLHDSGVAKQISEASGPVEIIVYAKLLAVMPGIAGEVYRHIWELVRRGELPPPTRLQFESGRLFFARGGAPFLQGRTAVTGSGLIARKGGARRVMHVVGTTYDFEEMLKLKQEGVKPSAIPTTPQMLKVGIARALDRIYHECRGQSVAIPVVGVRKGGLTFEQSRTAIKRAIEEHLGGQSALKRIVIVET